jgi:citronellol/citronellal dehydrogenase
MRSLQGKTLFITGASRGIGKAIGLRAAADGANVVIASKTAKRHPKLPGTIFTAAEEMEAAGGRALPLQVDVRFEEQVEEAMAKAAETFGGIDVLVNNASAIFLAGTLETPMKRFDLMHQVNVRATFLCSQKAVPYLERAENPHVLNLSPPLDREASWDPRWFAPHVAYTMAKYGMSLCVLGMAQELLGRGIAVNALWPRTVIHTAALAMLGGTVKPEQTRKPEIVADAAHAVLTRPAAECTGRFFLDDEVLAEEGVSDLERYAVSPGTALFPDLFVRSRDTSWSR